MKKIQILFLCLLLLSCAGMKKANEFYQNKNYDLVIKECKQAITKDSLNADAYLIMGKSFRALNKIDQAINSLQTAYQIKPHSKVTPEAKDELIAARLLNADNALKEKNYNLAFSEYKTVLELDSTNFHACYNLGIAYQENRWLDKAKYYFQKAGQISLNDNKVFQNLSNIDSLTRVADINFKKGKKYYEQKKNYSAVKYLKRALEDKDDHRDAKYYLHLARGKLLYKNGSKGQLWDAVEEFGKAMMLRPESAEPHYLLAKAYEKKDRNEFDNAINEYKIALKKEPDGPYARASKKKIRELTNRRHKLKKFWGK